MTLLVRQAIGKYINPTRYRQIIETESSERLTLEEQHFISEDQKHSSTVAKIFYKKKHSRKMALEGRKCMVKMTSEARSGVRENLMDMFNGINQQFDQSVLDKSRQILERDLTTANKSQTTTTLEGQSHVTNVVDSNRDPYQAVTECENRTILEEDILTDLAITQVVSPNKALENTRQSIPVDDIAVKREVVNRYVRKDTNKNVKFTEEEDEYLKQGILKYGRKAWALILKDKNFHFHPTRTRDSLRVRSDSSKFKRKL